MWAGSLICRLTQWGLFFPPSPGMLSLHHSHRVEHLLQALLEVTAQPLDNLFDPETILVQNQNMGRWLSQQIAEQTGIAANNRFALPASFIWSVFASEFNQLTTTPGYNPESLIWHCMRVLPQLREQDAFAAIQHYLSGHNPELKLYQLSCQIADLFDQYLVYRPEMILGWEAGRDDHWQARLWRSIRRDADQSHWAQLVSEFLDRASRRVIDTASLPERLSIFAVSSLSPAYLNLLAVLAKEIDVHFFVLNPSLNYWGDIVSKHDLARLRGLWSQQGKADQSDSYTVGHSLLASMGKQGRDFADQLHDFPCQDMEYFDTPEATSLLQHLQRDILLLQQPGTEYSPVIRIEVDQSIQVHSCHSPMREVQVLHDQLLQLFETVPDLAPHEILVMTPDMDQMAPYVDAVFGRSAMERMGYMGYRPPQIPYSISGHNDALSHPMIETLMGWLDLATERFEASTVLSWLMLPAIQRRFDLHEQHDEALQQIQHWIDQSGIRWGLDAGHKASLGLPEEDANTWGFGFQRLLTGYAMDLETDLYQGIAPFHDIEGMTAIWLGQLMHFIERLRYWRQIISTPSGISDWQERINQLISDLFLPDESEERLLDQFRTAMAKVADSASVAGFTDLISAQILSEQISRQLKKTHQSHSFPDGRVSFSTLAPNRGIPFRVICLLGMNDQIFPRTSHPPSFDLISQRPRKGDRSRRDDDRYLFLEAMLSARDVLYISYTGHSEKDNSIRLPSVVVDELLDCLDLGYRLDDAPARDSILTEHPLQAFSQRNFELGSYAAEWLARTQSSPIFIERPLSIDEPTVTSLELGELIKFFNNPSRFFIKNTLGASLHEADESIQDCEPFGLDNLEKYQLKNVFLTAAVMGESQDQQGLLQATGTLPHGALGELIYQKTIAPLPDLIQEIQQLTEDTLPPLEIDLSLNRIELQGWISSRTQSGVFRYRPARLKAKDRITVWIEHLALCTTEPDITSTHLAEDMLIRFDPIDQTQARQQLNKLVRIYLEGHRQPSPFFPSTSYQYAEQIKKGKTEEQAIGSARNKWHGGPYGRGDQEDAHFHQAFRGRDPLDNQFAQVAETFYLPLLDAQRITKR